MDLALGEGDRVTRISSIYQRGKADRDDAQEARSLQDYRKRAWQTHGVAVLDPNEITDDWARQSLINEANKIYGQRK